MEDAEEKSQMLVEWHGTPWHQGMSKYQKY